MASGATQATQATQQALHTQQASQDPAALQYGAHHIALGTQPPSMSQAHAGAYGYPQVGGREGSRGVTVAVQIERWVWQ